MVEHAFNAKCNECEYCLADAQTLEMASRKRAIDSCAKDEWTGKLLRRGADRKLRIFALDVSELAPPFPSKGDTF